jgi:hypothetical protein
MVTERAERAVVDPQSLEHDVGVVDGEDVGGVATWGIQAVPRSDGATNAASLNLAASCQPVLVTFSSRAGLCPLKLAELL